MGEPLLRLMGARMLGSMLGWGSVTGGLGLVAGIALAVVLARTAAVRVTFPGARWARGLLYAWLALACLVGGGALGGLHGAVRGFGEVVDDPSFAATTLRPAAAPVTDGLIQAVALQASLDPAPMLTGATPIPVAPLRAVLMDTTGAALFAGLRRVPALQASAAGRSGSVLVTALANAAASGKVDDALESVGFRAPMDELATALPTGPGATIARAALLVLVEQRFLPRLVQATLALGEKHMLLSGALWLFVALVAPVALLWLVEGIVRTARTRRPPVPPADAAPPSAPTS